MDLFIIDMICDQSKIAFFFFYKDSLKKRHCTKSTGNSALGHPVSDFSGYGSKQKVARQETGRNSDNLPVLGS